MKNYIKTEKCWIMSFHNVDEAYCYDRESFYCYAENRNKAKKKLLKYIKDNYYSIADDKGNDIDYLTIKVIRAKHYDKYLFEGKSLTLYSIDKILSERKRINVLDEMLNNKHEKPYCFIKKRGYYYRENCSGYADNKLEAGIYTIEKGISEAKGCNEIFIVPISKDEYNNLIGNIVNELKNKLITV